MKLKTVTLFVLLTGISQAAFSQSVKRVILFQIDGLHWQAPSQLDMPVFNGLIAEGTSIEKSCVIVPHHPTIGDYSKYNSCSFPNPVLHAGTIFIRPENRYIQEVFKGEQTAFMVNTAAYRSVARGFTTCIMDPSLTDGQVVEQAAVILKNQDPVFMRVHLQTPGDQGSAVAVSPPDSPYFRNIFGKGSPYVKSVEEADRLLGWFVDFLKKEGKWAETVLIVTSDHGQSRSGWHPLFDDDSWVTPLVFVGPGIAWGRELPYFEHTDLAPTIAWLLGKEAPNNDGGAGKAVHEILAAKEASNFHHSMVLKILNQQLKEFAVLKGKMILAAEKNPYLLYLLAALENEGLTPEPFYHQDRVTDWFKAGSTEHLLQANEKILIQMKDALKQH